MLITIEGGEGAGKSTLIASLKQVLSDQGHVIVSTREPGGTALGEQVRNLLLSNQNRMTAKTELLLLLAGRTQHIDEVLKPALSEGKVVLCDRFNDSSVAYQGHARGLGIDHVKALCDQVCKNFAPDVTLYLDIPPEEGLKRAGQEQQGPDRFEQEALDFHQKVREGFHQIAASEPLRVSIIDARQSVEKVLEEALKAVESRLQLQA